MAQRLPYDLAVDVAIDDRDDPPPHGDLEHVLDDREAIQARVLDECEYAETPRSSR
jgi:hypothetical protein